MDGKISENKGMIQNIIYERKWWIPIKRRIQIRCFLFLQPMRAMEYCGQHCSESDYSRPSVTTEIHFKRWFKEILTTNWSRFKFDAALP